MRETACFIYIYTRYIKFHQLLGPANEREQERERENGGTFCFWKAESVARFHSRQQQQQQQRRRWRRWE